MPNITVQESAAGSAIGTNLMAGNREQMKNSYRRVSRIGVVGSAVLGDSSLDLFYGSTYIGTFFPTTIGVVLPLEARDFVGVDPTIVCEPAEPINLLVSDVGVTNVMRATLVIEELG